MIPQIRCKTHPNENIVVLDIGQNPTRQNRSFCIECLGQAQPQKSIQLKNIPDQTTQYCNGMAEQIKEEYNQWINKVKQTIHSLNTLKNKLITAIDEIISKCFDYVIEYSNNMIKEQECYQNMLNSKLDLIAEILSGNHQRESKLEQNKGLSIQLGTEIGATFNQLINDEQTTIDNIREILFDQVKLQSQLKQEQICYALACNEKHNKIIGGRGNDIVIWEQNKFELIQKCVLKGHTGSITALVIHKSGDMFVSGGGTDDKSIKLWRKQYLLQNWYCKQTINDHKERITDLQFCQNQEQLISASSDNFIKIWRLKQRDQQLQCIQTLDEHKDQAYWITISQDSLIMASSSSENYFNIYNNEQTEYNPWKILHKIKTKEKNKRVYFTNNYELLVQQENPSQLMIYSKNINNQFQPTQEIKLNQPDDDNILFPIFQLKDRIYLKNEKFIYIIIKLKTGKYQIQQILKENYISGCRDCSGEGIVLWDCKNNSIDIYK